MLKLTNPLNNVKNAFNPGGALNGIDAAGAKFSEFLKEAVNTLHAGEKESFRGIVGQNDSTSLVTALMESRLTMKAITGIRKELLQAWNEIQHMSL